MSRTVQNETKQLSDVNTYVSPSSPSSRSVTVTVWLNTASWKMFPYREEEKEGRKGNKRRGEGKRKQGKEVKRTRQQKGKNNRKMREKQRGEEKEKRQIGERSEVSR